MRVEREWHKRLLAMILLWTGLCLAACQPQAAPPAKPAGLVKRFGDGKPLTVELHLDRQRLTMAGQLTVDLRAETKEGYAVKHEEVKEIPGFTVDSMTESKPQLTTPGRVAVTFRYLLEPLAPGSLQLPALTVESWDKGKEKADVTAVKTEPVTVRIDSMLAKDDPGKSISDIAPPLAEPISPWLWAGAGVAAAALLALIGYLWRKRRARGIELPPPLPPHLIAYQALDRLLATDLLASGEVQPFYGALTDILRHYIEQRFGLRAPERTTEEFLVELQGITSGPMATTANRLLLRDFLSRCDLVKFAKETPGRIEAEGAVEVCRSFVRETEPEPEISSPTQGGAA
jgi:hypothetical protein